MWPVSSGDNSLLAYHYKWPVFTYVIVDKIIHNSFKWQITGWKVSETTDRDSKLLLKNVGKQQIWNITVTSHSVSLSILNKT